MAKVYFEVRPLTYNDIPPIPTIPQKFQELILVLEEVRKGLSLSKRRHISEATYEQIVITGLGALKMKSPTSSHIFTCAPSCLA